MSTNKLLKKNTSSSAPEFIKRLENVKCETGQPVTLECHVRGYPAPEVTWEKAGEPLANTRTVRTEREGEKCKLHIKACTSKEAQTYSCVAVNKLGRAISTATVSLEGHTDGSPHASDNRITSQKSSNTSIGAPARSPMVKRASGEAVAELRKKFSSPPQARSVTSPPKKIDLKPKKLEKSIFFKRLPTFLMPPHGKSVTEGECVRLTCSVSGEPEPTVTWEKGGAVLKTGDRYATSHKDRLHTLEIAKATLADAGSYVAVVENQAGKITASLYLEVSSKTKTSTVTPERKSISTGAERKAVSIAIEKHASNNGVDKKTITSTAEKKPAARTTDRRFSEEGVKRKPRGVLPEIVRELKDLKVDDGKPCVVSCEVSGNPVPSITWKKNGSTFLGHQDAELSFDGQTAKLNIKEAYPEDEGQYVCVASNDSGKVETSCSLRVNVPVRDCTSPTFVRSLQDVVQTDGSSVTFTVQLAGTQPIEVVWVQNATEINDCPEFRHVKSADGCTHSLVIGEIFPEDAGFYSCEAYNKYGDAVSSCKLTVKDVDDVVENNNKENKIVTHERRKSIQTSDSNKEERSISKKMSSVPIEETRAKRNEYLRANDSSELPGVDSTSKQLKSLKEEGINGSTIPKILITEEPKLSTATTRKTAPQVIKGPQSVAVLRGETVTLKTHFIGSPAPNVIWIKGSCVSPTSQGTLLKNSERISIDIQEGLTVLTIREAVSEDSGKYVVTVENSSGSDCLFASVSVEGVPDAPAEKPLVSDVNGHSATVCWRGSPYDGGSVITGYVVEKCCLPDRRWTAASRASHTTSINIRDLLPDRKYIFRVRAENVHGTSGSSPESDTIVTTDKPVVEKVSPSSPMSIQEVEIEEGHLFSERFDTQESIGKGRFGTVYRCTEKSTGQTRAAKVIRCVKSKDRLKVKEEVEIMNKLRHPKLLQLICAFESTKETTLVMEYISGGELFERVIADDFVLHERDCILFVRQICEAVKYMHDCNVVHLDLKPENILCETKTSHQIKIIDFGLAKVYNRDESIRVLFGTPEFVAPEVIGYEPVGPYSDIWSVGVITYVLLTGLSPFMGDNDAETFTNITRAEYDFDDEAFDAISSDAKEFISQLFIKRPEKRMTAAACLKHSWLAKDQNQMSAVQLSTDKLKRFIIRRKWQKTGNAIRAIGRMANLSGVMTSHSPVSSQGSVADSDYSSNSHSLSSGRSGRSAALRAKLEEDGSGESGVGDTDSVDSSISDSKSNVIAN